MRGYGQPCPVAQAAELLTERWTPLVVRELLLGSRRFNDILRGVPAMSRSLLTLRLRALEDAGIVDRRKVGRAWEYHLTEAGQDLRQVVDAMGNWGIRWARREGLAERDLDVSFLMWDVHRSLRLDALPEQDVVIRLHYRDARDGQRTWWLRLSPREGAELFPADPDLVPDLHVRTDVRTMAMVWRGELAVATAIREKRLVLEGPADLVRSFPSWLSVCTWALTPAEASAAR